MAKEPYCVAGAYGDGAAGGDGGGVVPVRAPRVRVAVCGGSVAYMPYSYAVAAPAPATGEPAGSAWS